MVWVGVMASAIGAAAVPDDVLTPGVVATSDLAMICAPDYSRAHRQTSYDLKEWVAREYGVDRHVGSWEIDHRIPLCLGGADTAANLWPQPGAGPWNFRQKDDLEWYACRAVCEGRLPLSEAVGWFKGDWRSAYAAVFWVGTAY